MEFIDAKTILQKASHGEEWFGIDYNMNLYKGCPLKKNVKNMDYFIK